MLTYWFWATLTYLRPPWVWATCGPRPWLSPIYFLTAELPTVTAPEGSRRLLPVGEECFTPDLWPPGWSPRARCRLHQARPEVHVPVFSEGFGDSCSAKPIAFLTDVLSCLWLVQSCPPRMVLSHDEGKIFLAQMTLPACSTRRPLRSPCEWQCVKGSNAVSIKRDHFLETPGL